MSEREKSGHARIPVVLLYPSESLREKFDSAIIFVLVFVFVVRREEQILVLAAAAICFEVFAVGE